MSDLNQNSILFKNNSNIIICKPCTVDMYTQYMSLDRAFNAGFRNNDGNGTENLNNALSDVKAKGYLGIVVFEENPETHQSITKISIEIMEHYLSIGKCRVEIYNRKRVFILE